MIMPQADAPAAGFRPFFNPATGEWITYTAIAEDNHGQLVRFTWRSVRGGVITEHIHPRQEERFTILAGQAHFTLNGKEHVAGAGETVVFPAGVPHSEGNPGPGEIDGIVEGLISPDYLPLLGAPDRRRHAPCYCLELAEKPHLHTSTLRSPDTPAPEQQPPTALRSRPQRHGSAASAAGRRLPSRRTSQNHSDRGKDE